MANWILQRKQQIRLAIQLAVTAVTNGYVQGFIQGSIYQGTLKSVCVPGLNCYSCPGALGSCPIGSLQAAFNGHTVPFYLFGMFLAIGALLGRFVCGWLCPFGLIQDLLYKIPFFKKRKNLPGNHFLKYIKYVILGMFVIILPLFIVDLVGQGMPWFCKFICPSGTLTAGIPLIIANEGLQSAIGWLFAWKTFILAVLILLSLWVYRPFCKYLCPLGAIYGLFNRIALYRFEIREQHCTKCQHCKSACPMDIPVYENPNSGECIRCGKCRQACPEDAICSGFKREQK